VTNIFPFTNSTEAEYSQGIFNESINVQVPCPWAKEIEEIIKNRTNNFFIITPNNLIQIIFTVEIPNYMI